MNAIDVLNSLADAGEAYLKEEAENRERAQQEWLAGRWAEFLNAAKQMLPPIFPVPESPPKDFDGKHAFVLPFFPFGIAVWAEFYHNVYWKLSTFYVVAHPDFSRINVHDLEPEQYQNVHRLEVAIALARRAAQYPITQAQ